MQFPKISRTDQNRESEVKYDNIFEIESYTDGKRVLIGARERQVELMLEIAKKWKGPFAVLYVLITPRTGSRQGRYQASKPLNYEALESFSKTFHDFIEKDGRHSFWIMDLETGSQLIYDYHNVIFSYGDENNVSQMLSEKGFASKHVAIPQQHRHFYNRNLDFYEEKIMNYWKWRYFPLKKEDQVI